MHTTDPLRVFGTALSRLDQVDAMTIALNPKQQNDIAIARALVERRPFTILQLSTGEPHARELPFPCRRRPR